MTRPVDLHVVVASDGEPETFTVTEEDGTRFRMTSLPGGGQRVEISGTGPGEHTLDLEPATVKALRIYLEPVTLNCQERQT